MKKLLLLSLALFYVLYSIGQKSNLKDFDYVINRVKNDYPGYLDKVNSKNKTQLLNLEKEIRFKIKQSPDSCFKFLNKYLEWFQDKHLRISYYQNKKKNTSLSKDTLKRYFENYNLKKIKKLKHSLCGYWINYNNKLIIIKDNNKYLGISIDSKGYNKNQIMFESIQKTNKTFELTMFSYSGKVLKKKTTAELFNKDQILEFYNQTRFIRASNNFKYDMAYLASYIPKHPNGLNTYPLALNLNENTFYIRIPSFGNDYSNKIIKKYWKEITSRPNLIVDIRNNSGGQDYYYKKLLELIYTNPYNSKGVEWYSTKQIIKDWEFAIKNQGIKPGYEDNAKALVKAMKSNIGGFVNHPINKSGGIIKYDTVYKFPQKIGIIINENNASSAEQFLLSAKNSKKVTLFGNKNTAGILDYSNITPKKLPSGRYNLWLPATRSKRLPQYPIDNIGIAPDIKIPYKPTKQLYNRLDNWIYFVQYYLEL